MSETALSDFRLHELRGIDWGNVGGGRTASGIRVTADTSMACSAYTACIRVISDSVSSLPLHLFERQPNGGKRKVPEHPLYRILHMQPNPWQTAQEFRDWMTGLYLHYGASYAEIRAGVRGPVSELWPLHPSRMEVERLENGRLRYIYREPDGRQTVYRQEQIFALRFTTASIPSRATACSPTPSAWPRPLRPTGPRTSATVPGRASCLRATTRCPSKRPSVSASRGSGCTVARIGPTARRSCRPASRLTSSAGPTRRRSFSRRGNTKSLKSAGRFACRRT